MMVDTDEDTDVDVVLDLRDRVTPDAYSRERVVQWLRTSGGSLGERTMKHAAANYIEGRE